MVSLIYFLEAQEFFRNPRVGENQFLFLHRSVWSQGSPARWQIQISHFTWEPPISPNPHLFDSLLSGSRVCYDRAPCVPSGGLEIMVIRSWFRWLRNGVKWLGLKFIWMFPKIGVPPNGWFIMENPSKHLAISIFLYLTSSKSCINCSTWKNKRLEDFSKTLLLKEYGLFFFW